MQNQKVLLVGSLGFTLSNFIRKAAYEKSPYKFCGIDKVSDKRYLNNIYNNKIIENNYLADIQDEHIIDNIFEIEKPEIVIHASSPLDSHSNECITSNILGTKILVDKSVKYGVKKIIYLSSDQVYHPLSANLDKKLKESDYLYGKDIHSISKIAAENIISSSGLNYNILRLCQIYGPRQNISQLVPSIIKNIKEESQLTCDFNGLDLMDWMHVFDLSALIINILQNGKDREIYNVSSGQECSPVEITQFLCNILNKGHNLIKFKSNQTSVSYSLDNNKISNLNWKPMFKLKKGLEDTVDWFQVNQWFLK